MNTRKKEKKKRAFMAGVVTGVAIGLVGEQDIIRTAIDIPGIIHTMEEDGIHGIKLTKS